MAKKKASSTLKEGAPCRWCDGKYQEVKRPGGLPVTPSVFQFAVNNVKTVMARVFICDTCGHIEFLNVPRAVEDPNA